MENPTRISIENLNCPHCEMPHSDIDEWALKPHKTHLCLHCGSLFEGTRKAVSHPNFTNLNDADAWNEGFDDAFDLSPCEPQSGIPECRKAYFQGYADGIESWVKIEYPAIHHLGRFENYVKY